MKRNAEQHKNPAALFPNYFKKIGVAVMLAAFIPLVVIKTMHLKHTHDQSTMWRVFTFNLFNLGLWIIAWAKDKLEDEMTMFLRLKTIAWVFGFIVLFEVIKPVGNIVFKLPADDTPGGQLIMMMLLCYLLMYYSLKRKA